MGLGRTRTYAICRMLEELWAKIITKWVSQGVKLPRDAQAEMARRIQRILRTGRRKPYKTGVNRRRES